MNLKYNYSTNFASKVTALSGYINQYYLKTKFSMFGNFIKWIASALKYNFSLADFR